MITGSEQKHIVSSSSKRFLCSFAILVSLLSWQTLVSLSFSRHDFFKRGPESSVTADNSEHDRTIIRTANVLPANQDERESQSSLISPSSPPNDVHNDKHWNFYRIADGVNGYTNHGLGKVCNIWPHSLLCKYVTRTHEANNIAVLADIVDQWNTTANGRKNVVNKPSANTTVLHLRIGDALCGRYDLGSKQLYKGAKKVLCKGAKLGTENPRIPSCWENEMDCFLSSKGNFYAYPKDYYETVARDLLESIGKTTRIAVVADPSHWTRNKDKRNGDYSIDYAYRDNVISFFRSKGFDVQIHNLSGSPDDDFVYMSSAQSFIQGGGGFSSLVSRIVTTNGGRVFKPSKSIEPEKAKRKNEEEEWKTPEDDVGNSLPNKKLNFR